MSTHIYDDTSENARRQMCLDHFFDSLTCFSVVEGVQVEQTEQLAWIMSPDIPNWLTNAVFRSRFPDDIAGDMVDKTLQTFVSQHVSPHWRVCPGDTPSNLEDILTSTGFELQKTEIAMSIDIRNMHDPIEVSDDVTIQRVRDGDMLREQHALFSNMQSDSGKSLLTLLTDLFDSSGYDEESDWQHYVGLLDAKPVSYGSAYYATGVVGIYNVGTVPEARRKGFGTLITYQALVDAHKRGYLFGTLQSSPMGRSIYKKLGFSEHFDIRYYHYP